MSRPLRHLGYLLMVLATAARAQHAAPPASALDSAVAAAADLGFNGAILVAEGDRVLLDTVLGMADFERERSLEPTDRFDLASVSKQFTAAAVLWLVAADSFAVDAPVHTLLAGFPYPAVTVEHLLRHQSALPDYLDYEAFAFGDEVDVVDNAAILDYLAAEVPPLDTVPGTTYSYSNTGYAVLASVIEAVSGCPYADFLAEHLFDPAGMRDTRVQRHYDPPNPNPMRGYTVDGDTGALTDVQVHEDTRDYYRYYDGVVGDGMVHATAADLHAWWRALRSGAILPDAYVALMTTPDEVSGAYGMGLRRMRLAERELIAHAGGWAGYNNFAFYEPATDRYFVLLSNREYAGNVLGKVAGALLKGADAGQ